IFKIWPRGFYDTQTSTDTQFASFKVVFTRLFK
ncbi:hypothetical protein MGSAQ_002970, partial [marine sediment metagenome]